PMRALLIVLASLGVGHMAALPSAPGSDTLARLFRETPGLQLPHLFSLGLGEILHGRVFDPPARKCAASYGRMIQRSAGADSLSALWELAGVVSGCPFAAAEQLSPENVASLTGDGGEFLPQQAAPGEGARELASEHLRTGKPILTLGPGSALHLSAHASVVTPARLGHFCRGLRRQADRWRIARVTGRLMEGVLGAWTPVGDPLCCPIVPPRTILNAISERGFAVETVGGIHEAFARSGVTRAYNVPSPGGMPGLVDHLWAVPQNGVIFARLESHGLDGLAQTLPIFDEWLGCFLEKLDSDNLLLIAGTNGGGPGTDDRQEVPILAAYGGRAAPLGLRDTLGDVAATLAAFFGIAENGSPWSKHEPLLTFHRPRGHNGPWGKGS
ncbi:MAG: hypothetical protein PHQ12_13615, partial [Chthoniobacteraceae bacterium]|nr:hypothetical protein [Chthoniobacteraceae bacterium]